MMKLYRAHRRLVKRNGSNRIGASRAISDLGEGCGLFPEVRPLLMLARTA